MRSIIEVSACLIVVTIMCYLGIDYVKMNMQVSKVNETVQYVGDYIEIHGKVENNNTIDSTTIAQVQKYMNNYNISANYEYDCDTDDYYYFKMSMNYTIGSNFMNIKKQHLYEQIVRVPKLINA